MQLVIVFLLLATASLSVVEGRVYAWGKNDKGQLGLGFIDNGVTRIQPVPAYEGLVPRAIRSSTSFHLAMTANGEVYVAGANFYGQLCRSNDPVLTATLNPLLSGLNVYPGTGRAIGIKTATKSLFGWGLLAGYVAGYDTGKYHTPMPSLPSYDFDGKVVGVATAEDATFVLLSNGSVWAAGTASYGKLGLGDTTLQHVFRRVTFFDQVPIRAIVPSTSGHTCAYGAAGNESIYCWGKNNHGQQGVGHEFDNYTPQRLTFFDDNGYIVRQIVVGTSHTLALTCGGRVFAWGANGAGQLGQGYADTRVHPTPIEITSLRNKTVVELVSAAWSNFARTASNEWYVWGAGTPGLLGFGNNNEHHVPTLNPAFKSLNITRIASGSTSQSAFGWYDSAAPTSISNCPAIVNECADRTSTCDIKAQCIDTERGFQCKCGSGFAGDGIRPSAGGTGCIEIDECSPTNTNDCISVAKCVNTPGGYMCKCPNGFIGDGLNMGTGCTDANECMLGTHECVSNATCANTVGSYICTCKPGFNGNGLKITACGTGCSDIDECQQNSGPAYCAERAICTNTQGGYRCACAPGYSGDGYNPLALVKPNATGCTDIDECTKINSCDPAATCANVQGSYVCTCPNGYEGDGFLITAGGSGCKDINECTLYSPCDENAMCANNAGSFRCTCNPGYTGDGIKAALGGSGCIDKDECALGTDNCHVQATCVNTEGSHSCKCPDGYEGDGINTCADINECTRGTSQCQSPGTCQNTVGSYTCICPDGMKTDGFSCYNITCPAGQYANASSTCAKCPAGTWNGQTGAGECQKCVAGTYSTTIGAISISACKSCPAKQYSSVAGASSCSLCGPGTYSTAGSSACSNCPAGQYGKTGACVNCGAGWYSEEGSAECKPCPPGYYSTNTTASVCQVCPDGTYSKGKATACTSCPIGTYASKPGQAYCSKCELGTSTNSRTGQSFCEPCQPGYYASKMGSSNCTACLRGTYAQKWGSSGCTECAPGTYNALTAQSSCSVCRQYAFNGLSGATACSICYYGYSSEVEYGSAQCKPCPEGTYKDGSTAECKPCDPGSANPKSGQQHCGYCMGGYVADTCGLSNCRVCPPTTFSVFESVGQSSCETCPSGSVSFGTAHFCYS